MQKSSPNDQSVRNRNSVPLALLSLLLYMASDIVMPLYNKALFQGLGSTTGFHYPVTSSLLQVISVAISLLLATVIQYGIKMLIWRYRSLRHHVHDAQRETPSEIVVPGPDLGIEDDADHGVVSIQGKDNGDVNQQQPPQEQHDQQGNGNVEQQPLLRGSNDLEGSKYVHGQMPRLSVFDHFFTKIKELWHVSLLFASIITLSNIGIDKAPLNIAVLLRTTSIVWTIVFSFFIRSERPSLMQILCCGLVGTGAILLGVDLSVGWSFGRGNILGASINFVSAFISGFSGVLLRIVCLRTEAHPLSMSVTEITMYKMFMASLFMLIPAIIMEFILMSPNFLEAILNQYSVIVPMILLGVFITLSYQAAVVAIAAYFKAISGGIIHRLLTLPQLLLYTVLMAVHIIPEKWKLKVFKFTITTTTGAVITLVGTTLYGLMQFVRQKLRGKGKVKENHLDIGEETDKKGIERRYPWLKLII